jgi:hypothetical protein
MTLAEIKILAMWASELDQAGDYEAADGIDFAIEQLCLSKKPKHKDDRKLIEVLLEGAKELLEPEDKKIDDGIFGLNDADNPTSKAAMVRLACDLDQAELYAEADLIDKYIISRGQQDISSKPIGMLDPRDTAYTLHRMILHLLQRSGSENQVSFFNNLRKGLNNLSAVEISAKNANPAAAVGAAINIIKNVLTGQDASIVSAVIMELQRMV